MASLARPRDTAPRSPFAKSTQPRPTLRSRPELQLQLDRIIGSTCGSSTRFDANAAHNSFAYVAGAAAVLVTVEDNSRTVQKFFRANASQTASGRPQSSNAPSTPSASQDFRSRFTQRTREGSPFSASTPDAADSPGSSGHAKDRVKAATAVAISPNGKLLAYGETGYRPRVLVFPVSDKHSTDTPCAVISEHSFGVQAVAFGCEGRLLATLGVINDGFLYVWDVDQRTSAVALLASNKCTTSVKQIAWMGRNLVTVGVRFVKVWRVDEISPSSGVESEQFAALSNPGHRPLVGRNALLGDMLEATFTAVVPLTPTSAVICSDAGDICLLDDSEKQQRLTRLSVENFSITAASLLDADTLIVTGSNGETKTIQISSLQRSDTPLSRVTTPEARKSHQKAAIYPVAIAALDHVTVTVDNKHNIRFSKSALDPADDALAVPSDLTSHSDAIRGIRAASTSAPGTFITWSSDGHINGWTDDCRPTFQLEVPLEASDDPNDMINELKTIAAIPSCPLVVCGDRNGTLRTFDVTTKESVVNVRAHSSEVTDICTSEWQGTTCIATASRDRTVQVFTWKEADMELVQTLDEHAGAVISVCFSEDGQYLLSCSADRTVIVRERLSDPESGTFLYLAARTINLKSAPTAMVLGPASAQVLVSATDKTISTVDFHTGKTTSTFKANDGDGGDAVALSRLVHIDYAGSPLVAGVSSVDKSIRIYSEDGTLLARDWGHTEGVTGIAMLPVPSDQQSTPRIATTAADGTIFLWTLRPRLPSAAKTDDALPARTSSPLARPLRRVISLTEITRLRRAGTPPTPSGAETPPQARSPTRPARLSMSQAPKFSPRSPRTPVSRSPSPVRPSPARSPSKLAEVRLAARGPAERVDALLETLRDFATDGTVAREKLVALAGELDRVGLVVRRLVGETEKVEVAGH